LEGGHITWGKKALFGLRDPSSRKDCSTAWRPSGKEARKCKFHTGHNSKKETENQLMGKPGIFSAQVRLPRGLNRWANSPSCSTMPWGAYGGGENVFFRGTKRSGDRGGVHKAGEWASAGGWLVLLGEGRAGAGSGLEGAFPSKRNCFVSSKPVKRTHSPAPKKKKKKKRGPS